MDEKGSKMKNEKKKININLQIRKTPLQNNNNEKMKKHTIY